MLALGRFLPFLIAFPEINAAGFERTLFAVKLQRKLKERPAICFLPGFFVRFRTHESGDHGDIRIRLIVRKLLQVTQISVVVRVHPGAGGLHTDEFETQCAHAAMGCVLDGLELRTGDPQRRMWFLQRLWHDRALGKLEIFTVVFPAVIPEHRQHASDGVFPDIALISKPEIERVQFGHGCAFAQAEFYASIRHQIERCHSLCNARGMIGGELDDAVAKADVFRSLARRCEEDLRCGRMGILFEKMVFHFPGVVEAQLVSKFNLRQ